MIRQKRPTMQRRRRKRSTHLFCRNDVRRLTKTTLNRMSRRVYSTLGLKRTKLDTRKSDGDVGDLDDSLSQ